MCMCMPFFFYIFTGREEPERGDMSVHGQHVVESDEGITENSSVADQKRGKERGQSQLCWRDGAKEGKRGGGGIIVRG